MRGKGVRSRIVFALSSLKSQTYRGGIVELSLGITNEG